MRQITPGGVRRFRYIPIEMDEDTLALYNEYRAKLGHRVTHREALKQIIKSVVTKSSTRGMFHANH